MTPLAAIGHTIAQLGSSSASFEEKENLPDNNLQNFYNFPILDSSNSLNDTLPQNDDIENARILTTFNITSYHFFDYLLLLPPIKLKINYLDKQIHRFF